MEEYLESAILSGFLQKRNIKTLGVSVGWERIVIVVDVVAVVVDIA